MDEGFNAIDPVDGYKKPILTPNGLGITGTPKPLDGSGHLLPTGTSPPTPPVFLTFYRYPAIDYSIFNIN
jgi:hypothetical protein